MRVALVHQPYRPETGETAARVSERVAARGAGCELLSAFDLHPEDAARFDLGFSFGGDGTTLRTARWAVRDGLPGDLAPMPIVPVGMGTLSFLAELAPPDLDGRLDPYLAGDFWRDERTMLEVQADGTRAIALNDAVVARGATPRAVSLDLEVHGHPVARFTADGVVVATATGSTAYALAAGGPVLAPELHNMVVVPIAGHLSALGSLVLPETADITLTVVRSQPAILSADGQVDVQLPVGATAAIRVAHERTVFARRGDPRDFYARLAARLHR